MNNAIARRDYQEFFNLVKDGPPRCPVDSNHDGPMHYVARHGHHGFFTYLAVSSLIHMRNRRRETPLHVAVRHDHVMICEQLLAYGARVNVGNHLGFTPLALALHYGHSRTFWLLIRHGGSFRVEEF